MLHNQRTICKKSVDKSKREVKIKSYKTDDTQIHTKKNKSDVLLKWTRRILTFNYIK